MATARRRLTGLPARLLATPEQQRSTHSALLELGLYVSISVAAALVISVLHAQVNQIFLTMLGRPELPVALVIYLMLGPALWLLYVWQPRAIKNVFRHLQDVVADANARDMTPESFAESAQIRPLRRIVGGTILLALIVAIPLTWLFVALSPTLGRPDLPAFFLGINPFQLLLPWVVITFVNLYILTMVLLRHSIAIININYIIRNFGVTPKPFHPDGCNGLGSIGEYAIRSSWFALLYGFWVALIVIYSILRDRAYTDAIQNIFLWLVYVLAIAVFLIAPVWEAHINMRRHKIRTLEVIADNIRDYVSNDSDESELASYMEILKNKIDRYNIVNEACKEWPLSLPAIRGLSVAAVIPLVSTLVTTVVKVVGSGEASAR